MRVLLTWSANEEELARVRAVLPAGASVAAPAARPDSSRYAAATDDLVGEAGNADVVMGWVAPSELIRRAPKLRLVIWLHAGCDQLDFALLRERGIRVANVRGANAEVVAEQTFALLLGLAKQVIANHFAVVEGRWRGWWEPEMSSLPLTGRTIAVVGLGRVGAEVAKRAKAFNMRVLAVRRRPELGGEHVDAVHPPESLHAVLGQSDYVVLAVPLTPETHELIGEAALRAMKPQSLLINVARGRIVAERALHRALSEGWIRGYGSDLWWDYADAMPPSYHFPVPSRRGVHKLPNVLASGDAAANVLLVKDAMIDQGIENLAAFVAGRPLPRSVDTARGY